MSDINNAGSDLIFELEDRPPFHQALVGAITHLLAIFVPMVTPALIVGAALQLSAETTAYLVSMAMIASGSGTWLQVNRYGIVGSGLLSIQSVNFSFVTVMIALGSSMKSDGFHEELIMSSLLGVSFVGAFLVVGSSFILPYLRRVITPTVSGIVVLMIGLSLIKVGIIDFGGGFAAKSSGTFGNYEHLGVGLLVLIVVIGFNCCRSPLLRMGGIAIGLCVGYIASLCLGMVDFSPLADAAWLALPKFMPVMPTFDLQAIIAMCILFVATAVETVGNISGITNGAFDREPTPEEMRGGVMADSVGSLFGSFFGVLPVTTFAQNVGLVVVSRIVNRFVILTGVIFLLLCGFCPKISVLFSIMPQSVLGGAAVIMFSMIVVSGIQALGREKMDERTGLIIALSLGLGVGIGNIPSVLAQLPEWVNMIFAQNSIIMTFVVATVLNLILPKKKAPEPAAKQDQA